MRRPNRGLATRVAAVAAVAALLVPALSYAEEGSEDVSAAPLMGESHWYDTPLRFFDQTFDLIVVRPLSAVTLGTGAALFVGTAILTAPNGIDGISDAYDRFIREPGEYFWSRPLGEF
jgi:hypothetical protein